MRKSTLKRPPEKKHFKDTSTVMIHVQVVCHVAMHALRRSGSATGLRLIERLDGRIIPVQSGALPDSAR